MPGQGQCHYVGLLPTLVTALTHTTVCGDPPSVLGGFYGPHGPEQDVTPLLAQGRVSAHGRGTCVEPSV